MAYQLVTVPFLRGTVAQTSSTNSTATRKDGKPHGGNDYSVPLGTTIYSGTAGTVVWSGLNSGHGYAVVIKLDNGESILYSHMGTAGNPPANMPKMGDNVQAGAAIGTAGNTGYVEIQNKSNGVLHVTVFTQGATIDIEKAGKIIRDDGKIYSLGANSKTMSQVIDVDNYLKDNSSLFQPKLNITAPGASTQTYTWGTENAWIATTDDPAGFYKAGDQIIGTYDNNKNLISADINRKDGSQAQLTYSADRTKAYYTEWLTEQGVEAKSTQVEFDVGANGALTRAAKSFLYKGYEYDASGNPVPVEGHTAPTAVNPTLPSSALPTANQAEQNVLVNLTTQQYGVDASGVTLPSDLANQLMPSGNASALIADLRAQGYTVSIDADGVFAQKGSSYIFLGDGYMQTGDGTNIGTVEVRGNQLVVNKTLITSEIESTRTTQTYTLQGVPTGSSIVVTKGSIVETTQKNAAGDITSTNSTQTFDDGSAIEIKTEGGQQYILAKDTDGKRSVWKNLSTGVTETEEKRLQRIDDQIYSDVAGLLGGIRDKDDLSILLYGAKILVDFQLRAGADKVMVGDVNLGNFLGGAQALMGLTAGLNALKSKDDMTRMNGAVGLLSSANMLAGYMGITNQIAGKEAASGFLDANNLKMLNTVGAILAIANLKNLDQMLDNGQVGSAFATVVGAANAAAFLGTAGASALSGAGALIPLNPVLMIVVVFALNEMSKKEEPPPPPPVGWGEFTVDSSGVLQINYRSTTADGKDMPGDTALGKRILDASMLEIKAELVKALDADRKATTDSDRQLVLVESRLPKLHIQSWPSKVGNGESNYYYYAEMVHPQTGQKFGSEVARQDIKNAYVGLTITPEATVQRWQYNHLKAKFGDNQADWKTEGRRKKLRKSSLHKPLCAWLARQGRPGAANDAGRRAVA